MEILRQWVITVSCGAMIVAIANQLTPEGGPKKVGRLMGGLLLLLCVVSPMLEVDFTSIASAVAWSTVEWEGDYLTVNDELLKTIIGEQTGAYILDKAPELGIECHQVVVTCQVGEGEVWYPASVVVSGRFSDKEIETLSRRIEADLAIPTGEQTYEKREGETQ